MLIKVISALFLLLFIVFLLPWTQNVRSKGYVIALKPDQRPQTIQSIIGGKVEKWYVQEGQLVRAGDTIIQISEIKDAYFDPNLLSNTQLQLDAKTFSKMSYIEKVNALEKQIDALIKAKSLKLSQAKNKIEQSKLKVMSDSIDLEAVEINYDIAKDQYLRSKSLQEEGLRSLTELENRNSKWQDAQAKLGSQKNKLLTSRNELINNQIELNSIEAEYNDKIAKANSEKFTAFSNKYDAMAGINKLENQYANYEIRQQNYFITAPQDGYITKTTVTGIGETIKEGQAIASVMPTNYDLAVEMYVRPIDLPLFEKGQRVMIQFDGWPAVIFSGWPNISHGTYEGKVLAMDNFISENDMYRVLVQPVENEYAWPTQLRVGAGVKTISLFKNVQVWYEVWRQINGFPPDYYKNGTEGEKSFEIKKKK